MVKKSNKLVPYIVGGVVGVAVIVVGILYAVGVIGKSHSKKRTEFIHFFETTDIEIPNMFKDLQESFQDKNGESEVGIYDMQVNVNDVFDGETVTVSEVYSFLIDFMDELQFSQDDKKKLLSDSYDSLVFDGLDMHDDNGEPTGFKLQISDPGGWKNANTLTDEQINFVSYYSSMAGGRVLVVFLQNLGLNQVTTKDSEHFSNKNILSKKLCNIVGNRHPMCRK